MATEVSVGLVNVRLATLSQMPCLIVSRIRIFRLPLPMRTACVSFEEGEETMGDVMTVLPFQNTLATFRISGQRIVDALENGVSQAEEVKGRFPQVAGLSFV